MTKFLSFIGMTVGSLIGGYAPMIFGVSPFSYTSILTSGIGAILGLWVVLRFVD